jgi:hypothetical protein
MASIAVDHLRGSDRRVIGKAGPVADARNDLLVANSRTRRLLSLREQ